MKNIIMCGGNGSRLWPISRKMFPKQFCDLGFGESLFQKTVKRNRAFCDEIAVVTNSNQRFLAENQMDDIGENNYRILLEPVGRNTAPAVTLACMMFDEEDIILVSASDHLIQNQEKYEDAVKRAQELAKCGYIVTFGIKPNYPEVGYGYIEANGEDVISFKEKPNLETAQKYLENGNYYWNSGMFMFKVGTYLKELKKYSNEVFEKCSDAMNQYNNKQTVKIDYNKMMEIPSISIDYAVMEHSDKIKVVSSDIGWSDLGGYESLYTIEEKDINANAYAGQVVDMNCKNNLVIGQNRLITTIGISDTIIVDTDDALFISDRNNSHKIKELFPKLQEVNKDITNLHKKIYRPWGYYQTLSEEKGYKVKKMLLHQDKKQSEHVHHHRSEHWTVVQGLAGAIIGDKDIQINANESIYIPAGTVHRLYNVGHEDLIIVETSVGKMLVEEDIERYDDIEG